MPEDAANGVLSRPNGLSCSDGNGLAPGRRDFGQKPTSWFPL